MMSETGGNEMRGQAEPGGLTDIEFDGYLGHARRANAVVVAIVLVTTISLLVIVGRLRIVPPSVPFQIALICGLTVALLLLLAGWWRKRVQRIARETVAAIEHDGLASAIARTLDRVREMAAVSALEETLSLLAARGQGDTTLRICRANELVLLKPLEYPFEPQPLNEAHSALIRQQSADKESAAPTGAAAALVRNIRLGGGWFLLVIVGVDFVWALAKAVAQRTPTWHMFVFLVALLLLALMPPNAIRPHGWFVVPGGVVLRKSGWRQRHWELTLLERSRSVLCVSHWSRNIWSATIADATTSFSRHLTKAEAEFLLRAWLSPLPPPPLEQLADLR